MAEFEKMPLHERSNRAPPGVCELSIQSTLQLTDKQSSRLYKGITEYIEEGLEVREFEYDIEGAEDRVVVYTGTDRLDIATLRDIAEVYGQVTGYSDGNIPPEISLVPTSDGERSEMFFAWLEFKLNMELPFDEVTGQVEEVLGETELVPKNPVGDKMHAIVFRDGNMANAQVRRILNRCNKIRDSLPVDYIRLVCEQK